jgi:hypothetical protein
MAGVYVTVCGRRVTCVLWGPRQGHGVSRLVGHTGDVYAIVVGQERLVSGGDNGTLLEWALPNPQAVVEEMEPLDFRTLWALGANQQYRRIVEVTCMQVCSQILNCTGLEETSREHACVFALGTFRTIRF